MVYLIECTKCNEKKTAKEIVDLIKNYTDGTFGKNGGKIICGACGSQAYIHRESKLQEGGNPWKRDIKAVVRIPYREPYNPFIFLVSATKDKSPDAIHFNYYKDLRSTGGRLKQGHGPGGAPVFDIEDLFELIEKVLKLGYLRFSQVEKNFNILKKKYKK